jgi:ribonuclease HI
MELIAAIEALKKLGRMMNSKKATIFTDSLYLKTGITQWVKGWKRRGWMRAKKGVRVPIPNGDLWEQLNDLQAIHNAEWHWVPGHAGNPMNERCDQLAEKARNEGVTSMVNVRPQSGQP